MWPTVITPVVDALKVELLGEDRDKVLRRYTDDTQAYENYLKGRFHHYKYTPAGWRRAIEFYEKAVEITPAYAPAYAGITSSYGYLSFFGIMPAEEATAKMRVATQNAFRHDSSLAEAHLSAAMVSFFFEWDWSAAEASYAKAAAMDGSSAEALSFYAMFLAFQEHFEKAMKLCRRSLLMDPLSLLINMNAGWTYFTAGELEKAQEVVEKMVEIDPAFYGSYWITGAIKLAMGEYTAAIESLEKAISLGGHQTVLADLGSAYGLGGDKEKAEDVLARLLAMRETDYAAAICVARVYSRLGEKEKAIEWLGKAFEERNGELLFLQSEMEGSAGTDPLKELGHDPRVIKLFEKLGPR